MLLQKIKSNDLCLLCAKSKHPLYQTWYNMMRRCYRPHDASFKNYGARGIEVDKNWWNFKNFLRDMGDKPTIKHSLERVDNNAGYSKYNCKWATKTEQCLNRRKLKNNTTGETGICKTNYGFHVRFDYEGIRYDIGRFITFEKAVEARCKFVKMFYVNRENAIQSISKETVWNNSKSKVRGVTPHKDGGYLVRVTLNGNRHYVGYFKKLEDAIDARHRFITERNSSIKN